MSSVVAPRKPGQVSDAPGAGVLGGVVVDAVVVVLDVDAASVPSDPPPLHAASSSTHAIATSARMARRLDIGPEASQSAPSGSRTLIRRWPRSPSGSDTPTTPSC